MYTVLSFLISISPFHYSFSLFICLFTGAKVHPTCIDFFCDLRINSNISSRNLMVLMLHLP